jgi:hypothetical protein
VIGFVSGYLIGGAAAGISAEGDGEKFKSKFYLIFLGGGIGMLAGAGAAYLLAEHTEKQSAAPVSAQLSTTTHSALMNVSIPF